LPCAASPALEILAQSTRNSVGPGEILTSLWHTIRLVRRYNERVPEGLGGDHVTHGDSGVKLTYDDFLLFPDDGMRHELVDGEHYATASNQI
jgi:hypothetical protein